MGPLLTDSRAKPITVVARGLRERDVSRIVAPSSDRLAS
jgi:hypothetical protein